MTVRSDFPPARVRSGSWRRRMRGICILAACLFVTLDSSAMSIRELRALELSDKRHGPEFVEYYLIGALEGAVEASARDVRAGAKPLVCIQGRKFEPRMARSIYESELKRNAGVYEADMPVQLVLVNALAGIYPC